MKSLLSSFLITFASSGVIAATPPTAVQPSAATAPPQAQTSSKKLPPAIEHILLARAFVSKAWSQDDFLEAVHSSAAATLSAAFDPDANEGDKAEANSDLKHALDLLDPMIRDRLPKLAESYAAAYAREFSSDELYQMTLFAQSPVGRHYYSYQLALEADPAVQMQMEGFQLDMRSVIRQLLKEKCQEHTAQRIAAGDKNAKCPWSSVPDTRAS